VRKIKDCYSKHTHLENLTEQYSLFVSKFTTCISLKHEEIKHENFHNSIVVGNKSFFNYKRVK